MNHPHSRRAWILLCIACTVMAGLVPATAEEQSPAKVERLDLNKATEQQLVKLPGVGPAIARRIVEFREKNGPFKRVEDVMKVRGIGEKSFQKIKDRLRVGKASR